MVNIFYFLSSSLRDCSTFCVRLSRRLYGFYLRSTFGKADPKLKPNVLWQKRRRRPAREMWAYRDEAWNPISFMSQLSRHAVLDHWPTPDLPIRDNVPTNHRALFWETGIAVHAQGGKSNRWVFLRFNERLGSVYAISYDICILSPFKEIQFSFNYHSIMKRHRFMIVDNERLVFGVVENGGFYVPTKTAPITLEVGQSYHTRIEVIDNQYYYYIDGQLVMAVQSLTNRAKDGLGIAIILYESGAAREINAQLDSITVFEGRS